MSPKAKKIVDSIRAASCVIVNMEQMAKNCYDDRFTLSKWDDCWQESCIRYTEYYKDFDKAFVTGNEVLFGDGLRIELYRALPVEI